MPKFAVYQALMSRDDFSSDRQAAVMNMQIAEQQRAEAVAKTQNQLKNQELFGKMVKQLREMPVTEQDAERIRGVETQMRQQIVKDIGKYNGDLTAYLSSGGQAAINNYHQNVIESEEVQTALANKQNLVAAMKAMEEDKYLFKVDVEMEDVDEDGNPITKTTKMNWVDAYQAFQKGQTKKINFNGAEEKGTIDMDDFKNEMRNALDPWSDDNIVRESDIYKKLVFEKNISEEQALELTNRYGKNVEETGNKWYWGNEQLWQIRNQQEMMALRKWEAKKSSSGGGGSEGTIKINADINAITALKEGNVMPMHHKGRDFWAKTLGAVKTEDGNYKFNRGLNGYLLGDESGDAYDVGAAESVYLENYIGTKDGAAIRIKALYDENNLKEDSGAPVWGGFFGGGTVEYINQHNTKVLEGGKYLVTMTIPIENFVQDETVRSAMTAEMNITNKQSEVAPYNTTIQRQLMQAREIIESAKASGVSEEDLANYLLNQ